MNRNRLILVAVAVGAAAVVAAVLVLIGGGTSSTAETTTSAATTAAPSDPLAGIPQRGDTLGRADAPVTLTVYEDPQCPYCRQWNVDTLPTVVNDYVRPGRLKLVFRGINIIGPNSEVGLRAIYAAGAQNKLWNLVDALYARQGEENSGWIDDATIRAAADEAGADADKILAARKGVTPQLAAAEAAAEAAAVRGTPTFVLERPPGLPQQLAVQGLDPASFTASLAAALQ